VAYYKTQGTGSTLPKKKKEQEQEQEKRTCCRRLQRTDEIKMYIIDRIIK
jgi:hypothetical protein